MHRQSYYAFGSLRSTRRQAPAPPLSNKTPAVATGAVLCAPPFCVHRQSYYAFGSLRSMRRQAPAPPLNNKTPAVATDAFLCAPPFCVQIQHQILKLRPATVPNASKSSFFEFLAPKIGGGGVLGPQQNPICEVKRAIFRILRLFWGMMSLGKKYLFLATVEGHSDPPPSPITQIPIFLNSPPQK